LAYLPQTYGVRKFELFSVKSKKPEFVFERLRQTFRSERKTQTFYKEKLFANAFKEMLPFSDQNFSTLV